MSKSKWLERCVLAHPDLTLCLTEKAFSAAYRHVFRSRKDSPEMPIWVDDDADAMMHTLSEGADILACIVCLDDSSVGTLSQLVALMAHEAQHVVQEVQRQHNALPLGDDEMECGLLDHITMRLMESYMEQTNRPDKLPRRRAGSGHR